MLQHISWYTYAVSILFAITIYYLYIGLTFYRVEIRGFIDKLLGRQPAFKSSGLGGLQFPDYAITGKAQADDIAFVDPEDLSFGPPDSPDERSNEEPSSTFIASGKSSRLVGDFSEMVSEVKTLIRVINESGESKENFEMLFRLITQKYPSLSETDYQRQINDFLLDEAATHFPFPLSDTDLANYWINED
jgi:hypothetical protein